MRKCDVFIIVILSVLSHRTFVRKCDAFIIVILSVLYHRTFVRNWDALNTDILSHRKCDARNSYTIGLISLNICEKLRRTQHSYTIGLIPSNICEKMRRIHHSYIIGLISSNIYEKLRRTQHRYTIGLIPSKHATYSTHFINSYMSVWQMLMRIKPIADDPCVNRTHYDLATLPQHDTDA